MKTPTLETDRLILREIHPGDTDVIFNGWMDDENVSRYMWWNASNDINATKEFWGNEYATEAMRTVIKYAVEEMNITEISTEKYLTNVTVAISLRREDIAATKWGKFPERNG